MNRKIQGIFLIGMGISLTIYTVMPDMYWWEDILFVGLAICNFIIGLMLLYVKKEKEDA